MTAARHLRFLVMLCCLGLVANCSKEPDIDSTPASPESPDGQSGPLAYQESVNAVMDQMKLRMAYQEDGQRKTMQGLVTMSKERFATVVHSTSQMKRIHLRRWARLHTAEITDSEIPRANRTQESPLTDARLEADKLPGDQWRFRLTDKPETPENVTALKELEKVESAYTQFYHGHRVREGESWQVPAPAIARWFGDEVAEMIGSINLKVTGSETIENHACAVIDVELNTTGKMTDDEGKISDLELIAKGKIWRAVDFQEDLKVEITGNVKLTAIIPDDSAEVIISGPIAITESRRIKK